MFVWIACAFTRQHKYASGLSESARAMQARCADGGDDVPKVWSACA